LPVKEEVPVLPEYLTLYFNSAKGRQAFNRLTERTTIPYLNRSNLEQMEVPVPNLETQQKLIALEHTKQRYARLTERKVELLNQLINHQLI
jgi:restriction endonuclease S subunit